MVSSGMEKGKLNELHCRIQDNEVNLADIEERMNKARIRKVQICKDLEKSTALLFAL